MYLIMFFSELHDSFVSKGVVSYCFGDTFACVPCCFSSTVSIFHFAPGLISLIPLPRVSFPLSPVTSWAYYSIIYLFSLNFLSVTNYFLLFNHLFVFFEFSLNSLSVTNYLYFKWLTCPCLCPVPFFVLGPSGFLATGCCCWVVWGFRSLNAAFPCWFLPFI
jgi:hypothetical protein